MFKKCHAFGYKSKLLWNAEHPQVDILRFIFNLWNFISKRLWTFACFIRAIDFRIRKLIEAEFTK